MLDGKSFFEGGEPVFNIFFCSLWLRLALHSRVTPPMAFDSEITLALVASELRELVKVRFERRLFKARNLLYLFHFYSNEHVHGSICHLPRSDGNFQKRPAVFRTSLFQVVRTSELATAPSHFSIHICHRPAMSATAMIVIAIWVMKNSTEGYKIRKV